MRPIAVYSALRLGIFLAGMILLVLLGARPLLAALLAAIISFGVSFVLLRRQRDEVTRVLERRHTERRARRPRGAGGPGGGLFGRRIAEDAEAEDAEAEDAEAEAEARRTGA